MKKRICTILFTLFLTCSLTACNGTYSSSTSTPTETASNYFCYYTDNTNDYLNFLENFDDEKYEIFNISHGNTYWYVTYKLRQIEE